MNTRLAAPAIGLILSSLLWLSPLQAHNVVAGAYVDGMTVEGEIGFSNGEPALAGVKVLIVDQAGNPLGETHTEADGLFSFEATQAIEHTFKADLGAGHVAEIIVSADEFTPDVTNKAVTTPTATGTTNTSDTTHTDTTIATGVAPGISAEQLESIIRRAVSQQIKPLQKELRAYKEKVMFRDITGGLGFIFGLFGVAAWMAARKPARKSTTEQE